jgi:hypothetical protein
MNSAHVVLRLRSGAGCASSKPNSPRLAGDFRGLGIKSQNEEMVL